MWLLLLMGRIEGCIRYIDPYIDSPIDPYIYSIQKIHYSSIPAATKLCKNL